MKKGYIRVGLGLVINFRTAHGVTLHGVRTNLHTTCTSISIGTDSDTARGFIRINWKVASGGVVIRSEA